MKKRVKKVVFSLLALVLVGILSMGCWIYFGGKMSNFHNYATIGDIPTPSGFERIPGDDAAYATYLRSLPLKERGSRLICYTGEEASYQALNYAVVDIPLLSNYEQCADACIRFRCEYLFRSGKYGSIRFRDVNGKALNYGGGASRQAFERYLKKTYEMASTFSLSRDLKVRPLKDMQPGDIFVYPKPADRPCGHAVMVADVAYNPKTGKKAFLLVQGNTPAQSIHVMRNITNPIRSPWFILDEDSKNLRIDVFNFKAEDLRKF